MHRSPIIHERFLRHIWSRQYLRTTSLKTVDGKPLRVLDVGTLNLGGGPDFLNAKLKIGDTTFSGDIEIHRNVAEWFEHMHQEDPRYNKVILHVVLEGDALQPTVVESGRVLPVLLLEPFLSESIRSIWQKSILDERARKDQSIKCFRKNGSVGSELIERWINRLAVERLEVKLRRFEERLKQLAYEHLMAREPFRAYAALPVQGYPEEIPPPLQDPTRRDYSKKELWEQLLYEGIMEGLGYSKNQEPFVRLARSVTLQRLKELSASSNDMKIQALLFGAAGLLPTLSSLKEKESKLFAKQLSGEWKELRASFHAPILHAGDWQFFPTRPTNFPTIRLGAAGAVVQKLLSEDLFRAFIQALKSRPFPRDFPRTVVGLLEVSTPEFWRHHYQFDQATTTPVTALGRTRIEEIFINTLLPIALLYARIFKDKEVREGALKCYETIPAPGENSLTRLMEKQLLAKRLRIKTASAQQGVIQLYKYYCQEERCLECDIGRVVFDDARG